MQVSGSGALQPSTAPDPLLLCCLHPLLCPVCQDDGGTWYLELWLRGLGHARHLGGADLGQEAQKEDLRDTDV